MGKKRSNPRKQKSRKARPGVKRGADESFQHGPLRISRWDNVVQIENLCSEAQQEELNERFAAQYPSVCGTVDDCVAEIIKVIKTLDPINLMAQSYWHFVATRIDAQPEESKATDQQRLAIWMMNYLQDLIACTPPDRQTVSVSDEHITTLSKLVDRLYRVILGQYFLVRSAARRKEPDYDVSEDDFVVRTQMHRCVVHGCRYLSHEVLHHDDLFELQDDILRQSFGVSARGLVDGLARLLDSLTKGIFKAVEEMHSFMEESLEAVAELRKRLGDTRATDEQLMEQVVKDNGWEERRDSLAGRLQGPDLFDVAKMTSWPERLIDELSVEPGGDSEFMKPPHPGWPIQSSSTRFQPFLKWQGRSFCFCVQRLTDNFYRAVEKAVRRTRPDLSQQWASNQKVVTEWLPFKLLRRVLDGAEWFQGVHYRTTTGAQGKRDWAEGDGLLIYDRHLIVVEVRAGSYTHSSPESDLDGHLESLANVLVKPIRQANRFIEELHQRGEVDLCNESHSVLRTIREADFDEITPCCVTLDQLDDIAATIRRLTELKLDIGDRPVWCVSIDDLRVYSDVFTNPLVFLDFVNERMRAHVQKDLQMWDELDHLGAYLDHNRYVTYSEEFQAPVSLSAGYRDKLDRYYAAKLRGEATAPPGQEMPPRLFQIVDLLAQSKQPGRAAVAEALLCLSGDTRSELSNAIARTLELQRRKGRARPLSLTGSPRLTVFCDQSPIVSTEFDDAVDHAVAVMDIENADEWTLIHLRYAREGFLEKVRWRILNRNDLQAVDPAKHEEICGKLRARRESTSG